MAGDETERADPQCQAPERAAYRGLHPPPTGAGIRSKRGAGPGGVGSGAR